MHQRPRSGLDAAMAVAGVIAIACSIQPVYAKRMPPQDMTPYVVRADDSLYTLADRYMQSPSDWRLLRDINHVANPRHLQVNAHLSMPTSRLRQTLPTAQVVAVRGSVEKLGTAGAPATPVGAGTLLREGDEVSTGRDAFVSMTLPDGSHVVLPSSSRILIGRLRTTLLTGAVDRQFDLKQGEVTTDVTPFKNPRDSFRVVTPSVVAGVRGTRFRVNYLAEQDATAVEVLAGKIGVDGAGPDGAGNSTLNSAATPLPVQGGAQTLVLAGYGNLTRTGDAAGASVRLLAPPDIADPGKLQRAPQVSFDLTPVDGARAYRTEIATDADFLDLLRDERTTGLHAAFDNIPDGNYFVRVLATDTHGIDGLPQVFTFSRYTDTTNAAATPVKGNGYVFRWHVDGGALGARYRFILSDHADLSAPYIDLLDVAGGEMTVANLPPGKYYWTIVVDTFENGRLLSIPSEIRSFTQTR
ncbi:peptidoglycan-binding LysM [Caballeronia udeis]|uniref:Peptidoglycan-binding LysM n=1 Tax=Caballeronia udeis TaxID=1232866 RepID=A0A158I0J4_9BURK|nr:FecR domain-containing protein [Caballeronia udeis]SAL49977.1 peptidoglycan-binding LysM [Caballeronia udeis]